MGLLTAPANHIVTADEYDNIPLSCAMGVIGGTRYSGGGTFVTGLSTSEALFNMSTGNVNLLANRRYHIHVKFKLTNGSGTQAVVVHIRDTNLAGTIRAEFVADAANIGSGHTWEFFGEYETSAAETKNWVVTGNTTSSTANVVGGGSGFPWVLVEDVGPAGLTVVSASP